MKMPEIVATIGHLLKENEIDLFENLINQNVRYFRFNLSKYEEINEIKYRAEFINKVSAKFKKDIKIMIDIPYPGRKPRIYFNKNEMSVKKDDIIIISSEMEKAKENNYIYIDLKTIGRILKKDTKIIYSDGECQLVVKEVIDDNTIKVKICNDAIIFTRKSLSFNYVTRNIDLDKEYIEIINSISADSIAFSFISGKEDILQISKYYKDIEIISKIESKMGMDNLNEICECSNIMLGRGDLILNSNIHNLFNYQKDAIDICRNQNKKIYIATGILSSLLDNVVPNQADIIDLSNMLLSQPDYIILNFPVIIRRYRTAINTINNVYECLCDKI